MTKLAIVMPAYNEEECIQTVVERWTQLLKDLPGSNSSGKLVVVNDGSKDRTGAELDTLAQTNSSLVVVHQKNAGHGAAVMRGYAEALKTGAEYVFQTDSDDQFDPKDFWLLWEKRNSSPFILGFRKNRQDALHRKVISKVVGAMNFALFGVALRDANIPFRLIRADFLRGLLNVVPGDVFAPNIFLSVLAKKAGANLFEIPVHHQERETGQVSILKLKLLKVCLRSAKELASFRWMLITNPKREELRAWKESNT